MQFSITAIVALFAASALADCGNPGDQCNSPGSTACQCNGGNLVSCETRDGGAPGYAWRFYGDCPPNAGGLSCVNGGCTIHA